MQNKTKQRKTTPQDFWTKDQKKATKNQQKKNDKKHEQIHLIIYILTYNPLDIWKKIYTH